MQTVYVINSDSMGAGDAGLGAKILGAFIRTLTTLDPKPEALLFYNAGVKLLARDSPYLEGLKALDDAGVELLACVTCLEHFQLMDRLGVGRVSNMREIVSHMQQAAKVVTL